MPLAAASVTCELSCDDNPIGNHDARVVIQRRFVLRACRRSTLFEPSYIAHRRAAPTTRTDPGNVGAADRRIGARPATVLLLGHPDAGYGRLCLQCSPPNRFDNHPVRCWRRLDRIQPVGLPAKASLQHLSHVCGAGQSGCLHARRKHRKGWRGPSDRLSDRLGCHLAWAKGQCGTGKSKQRGVDEVVRPLLVRVTKRRLGPDLVPVSPASGGLQTPVNGHNYGHGRFTILCVSKRRYRSPCRGALRFHRRHAERRPGQPGLHWRRMGKR